MKKIEAIIKPEYLEGVRLALQEKGIIGITVTEVQGRGRQKGISLQWRAGEYRVEFMEKIRLDIVVNNEDVENAIAAILSVAKTGHVGDGKIFIYPIEDVLRISTGERGREAV